MQSTAITNEQISQIVVAINKLGDPSIIDYATLIIAALSFIIAIAAAAYSKHQRDVARRSEKQAIHTELLDILYYLKGYNGELDENAGINFKKLQKLKTIAESVFSIKARKFIEGALQKMHDMPARKNAYEKGVSKEAAELYEALGIDPNIHDALGIEYMNLKIYFSKKAFEEFEELFSVNV